MRGWLLAALWLAGCGGKDARPPDDRVDREHGAQLPIDPAEPTAVTVPDFPEGTRSLELVHTTAVRLEPGDGKRIGTVAVDTRVGWVRTAKAKGCQKAWIEIRPRGWICGDYVKPSSKAPFGREVPMLDRAELVPGVYGKVTAPNSVTFTVDKPKPAKDDRTSRKPKPKQHQGPITSPSDVVQLTLKPQPKLVEGRPLVGSVNVRQYEELAVDGKVYWRISQKDPEYVLRQAITPHRPSVYGGARLGDDTGWTGPTITAPASAETIGFVWPRVVGWQQVYTTNKAIGGGVNRQLAARTPVAILEISADKAGRPVAYRIGLAEWIAAADVRVFAAAPPPPLLEKGERWIDVDLDNQILVAFEGDTPVYSTMVSSGGKDTPTEIGVYRMWLKESEADMKGLNGEDPYSVATVPWTQFFSPEKGLALHTAYWHDQFGARRSHGCVNLAPRDARWLYFWSDPQVPPGWTMAAGVIEAPGSIVRIRTKEEPSPEPRGYARKVIELRQQNAPVK
ncbi:MAG: ErfK/YbiS/YcfS/YnhG family protein [Deltaproteobacteria bacterium]|nr:ErfK/YbiS/YcfS/YnhG family protein [Deltaproteobacteria bacterium]